MRTRSTLNRSRRTVVTGPARRRGAMPKAASSRQAGKKSSARRPTSGLKRGRAATTARKGKTQAKGRAAQSTTDHDEIRKWAEERGGHPAMVKRGKGGKKNGGILRIDFPGYTGAASLKPVSWEEWFDVFEERKLAFLYQKKSPSGKPSRFNKLVCR